MEKLFISFFFLFLPVLPDNVGNLELQWPPWREAKNSWGPSATQD